MKKLVSLLLAVCMCLSISVMLTACGHEHTYQTEWSKDATHHWHACEGEDCTEVSDKAEHTWNNGEITTPATAEADGVKTFTCTVCGQTKDESYTVKTTVTSGEWKAMFTPTNVTINGSYEENGDETVTIKAADGKWMYIVVESDETFGEYYLRQNDAWYVASYEDGKWDEEPHIAKWLSDKGDTLTLGDVWERFGGYEDKFEQFSYDENLKAYVDGKIVVYVEDGRLAKIEYYTDMDRQTVESDFLFVNYGTTVISETAE